VFVLVAFLAMGVVPAFAAPAPAVFYVPHPDDESIGMAQAIASHLGAGRDCYVVLMTDGEESGALASWTANGFAQWGRPAKSYDADGDVDKNDFALAKREDFRLAMIQIANGLDPDGIDVTSAAGADLILDYRGLGDPAGTQLASPAPGTEYRFGNETLSDAQRYIDLKAVMYTYNSMATGVSHKTVMKAIPGNDLLGDNALPAHTDHTALANGLRTKANYGWDCRWYKVYEYYKASGRTAPYVPSGPAYAHTRKVNALNQHVIAAHYGSSVPTLISHAQADNNEYVINTTAGW
jgi:hypothetical protein